MVKLIIFLIIPVVTIYIFGILILYKNYRVIKFTILVIKIFKLIVYNHLTIFDKLAITTCEEIFYTLLCDINMHLSFLKSQYEH